ncbi:MAG TPA: O-antigen ligase family protein [Acidobacteriota bacterium]|nr:O-antigen ligase family protein [Acidobacteriota bacterium]
MCPLTKDSSGALPASRCPTVAVWAGWFAVAVAVSSLLSVFLSGLFLACAASCWLLDMLRSRRWTLRLPPFGLWLLLYAGVVVVAVVVSPDPWAGLRYLKKLLRFLGILLLYTYAARRQVLWGFALVASLGVLSAGWGLVEYAGWKEIDLLHRVDGFMSHWMTFSGQMMVITLLLLSVFLRRPGFSWNNHRLGRLTLAAGGVTGAAVVVTFTRSAWLGLAVGLGFLLALERRKWVLPGLLGLVLGFYLLPYSFHERLASGLDLKDTTTQGRLELLETGWEMVRSHPWFGVGPRLVQRTAVELRGRRFPEEIYQHLHNNPLQIAAETGLVALSLWVVWWLVIARDLWRIRRVDHEPAATAASGALAVLVAFHVMGMFEYNFGDSEMFALLGFCVTAPYILASSVAVEGGRPAGSKGTDGGEPEVAVEATVV